MIQDIIVNLSVGRPQDPALDYAVTLAQAFDADLTGVAFRYEPVIVASPMDGMPVDLIEAQRVESAKTANEAIARFKRVTGKTKLSAETQTVDVSASGAGDQFGRLARTFDIAVVGQPPPDHSAAEDLIVQGALFSSGRPVILVPYIQKDAIKLDRVMVCWDGSRTAARALADAMPLVERAKTIEVVTIAAARAKEDGNPGVEVGHHLARRGLKAEIKRIVGDTDVASMLLSHAADSSADIMVMGGYGHSRMREFMLGGATRGILTAMTVPVLMSH
jgi:nucleotide-binding universal stress UspA family protein